MREGEVQVRVGSCLDRHIPPATFGSLAICPKALRWRRRSCGKLVLRFFGAN